MSKEIGDDDIVEASNPPLKKWTSYIVDSLVVRDIKELGSGLLALIVALLVMAVMISAAKINPLEAYLALVKGSLGSLNGISETLVRATPLIFIGLGIAIAFRGGMWNIGGDGQLYLGALGATIVGVYLPPMPPVIHITIELLSGFIFGALWAAIPAYLKMRRGTNEIVVTIMLNYIAEFLISYLVAGPMKDNTRLIPVPESRQIAASAVLPIFIPHTQIHAGFLIAIAAAFVVWLIIERTVLGYEIKAGGENAEAARYGGINVLRMGFVAMVISGGLAGIAGMSEVAGVHYYLMDGITPGYGFLAIAVALFAGLNPLGVVLSALFFGALMVGAESMQSAVGVPVATIYLLEGLVIIFVLARRVLSRHRRSG
ncbi:MAG: ABC transporter permease [Anaerolineales bacterium]|jgi:simple sugar transport system permease protein